MKSAKASVIQLVKLTLVATVALAMGSCATTGNLFRQNTSSLPVEVRDSTGGQIVSTQAFESSDRLYVSGSMRKQTGSSIPPTAHVDVRLIDASGNIIAEKRDDIEPRHPRISSARGGRYSYVASFPLVEARRASKIVVKYDLNHNSSSSAR